MSLKYRFLDEVSISKQQDSLVYSSKWWAYGTRTELESWMPSPGDSAEFSFLDSDNVLLGKKWAPDGYIIKDCRATALDRFEWDVFVSAESPSFKGNFTYPRDKSNLSSKEEIDVEKGAFTITEEMAGYKWDAAGKRYEDLSLTENPPWSEATDCPFTVRPTKFQINQTIPVAIIKQTIYLAGSPDTYISNFLAFKGIQTIKSQSGRVIESNMAQVNDDKANIFTQWKRAIMVAPSNFIWNSNWKGI